MKKNKYYFILLISLLCLLNCTSKSSNINERDKDHIKKNDSNSKNMNIIQMDTTKLFKDILHSQVNRGGAYYYFTQYKEADFLASLNIIKDILKNNGYKFSPSFDERVQNIFHINVQKKIDYICINKYTGCIEESDFKFDEEGQDPYIYVVFREKYITDFILLPLLFDYRKLYPDIAEEGDIPKMDEYSDGTKEERLLWKDVEQLDKLRENNNNKIIHRNKYLFENSKASLTWLLNNDLDFLKILVYTFGYDNEPKINGLVLNDVFIESYQDHNDYKEILRLLAKKNEARKICIREGLLKYILNNASKENNKLSIMLDDCGIAISNNIINNDNILADFTRDEKLKLLAYISYYSELTYSKLGITVNDFGWNPNSCLFNALIRNDKLGLLNNLKENNYYNLPDFENLILQIEDEIGTK